MRTSVSAKRCPECGKATMLQAASCSDCGHQFRTRFVEPIERTQAVQVMLMPHLDARILRRPSPVKTYRLAFLSSFLLVACLGALVWLVWNAGHSPAKPHQSAVTSIKLPPSSRAQHLYNAIGLTMSLYDLDQAAGSSGRVIQGSDPHTLLLSYDYPNQRVQVSLNRTDVTGDDYRVQAVALYQGKTLLQRHADID